MERDSGALIGGIGAALAIAVGGLLVSVRDWFGPANVVLVLAVIIVAAATLGGRLAGVITSVGATLSFDFFHTEPYYTLRISEREDIITAVLLLALGLIVGELADLRASSRREVLLHAQGASRLEDVASVVAAGADLDEVWPVVRRALTEQLQLSNCRFEPGASQERITTIDRNGSLDAKALEWVHGGGFALPARGVAVPVVNNGRTLGRLVLVPCPGTGTTRPQRRVAVALADQLGIAAAHSQPLHPLA